MNEEPTLQRQIGQLSEQIATLIHHVAEVRSTNRDLASRLARLEEQGSELGQRMTKLEQEVSVLRLEIVALRKDMTEEIAAVRREMTQEIAALRKETTDGFPLANDRLAYLSGKIDHFVQVPMRENMEMRRRVEEYVYDRKAELTRLTARVMQVEERLSRVEAAVTPGC